MQKAARKEAHILLAFAVAFTDIGEKKKATSRDEDPFLALKLEFGATTDLKIKAHFSGLLPPSVSLLHLDMAAGRSSSASQSRYSERSSVLV